MSEEKANINPQALLFPEIDDSERLIGIARIASHASLADTGHQVEYRSLNVRSILNTSVSKRGLPFRKSINPYRGCEFACRYCYARYTHEFMELRDPELFEKRIFIKQNAAWLLKQELRKLRPNERIALGTATDPYQPIERRLKITQSLLEVMAECRGLRLGIVTKSPLILRDIALLKRLAEKNRLVLHITITTPDVRLARILEPRAPRPDLRFRTVATLRNAGLRTGILCCPIMPGITDTPSAFDSMAKRAKEVDANFLAANPLFLKPCSKGTFLAFVKQYFPALEASYEKRYAEDAFVSKAYSKRISDMLAAVVRKYGLGVRQDEVPPALDLDTDHSGPWQQSLWPESGKAPQPAHSTEKSRSISA